MSRYCPTCGHEVVARVAVLPAPVLVDADAVLAAVRGMGKRPAGREPLFARLSYETSARLKAYVQQHGVTLQDVVTVLVESLLDDEGAGE